MGRRNIRPPLAGGGPARSGELFRRGPFSDGLDHIFGENRGRRSAQNYSPPRARSLALALNTQHSARLHACTPAPGLGNYGGLCRPVERGCRSHRRHGPFWPCPAEARGVDDSKLVPRTRMQSSSQGPIYDAKARPKARPCHGLVGWEEPTARPKSRQHNKDPVGRQKIGEASQNFVRLQRHFGCWGSFLTKNCESIIGVGKLQELETSSESDEMENS